MDVPARRAPYGLGARHAAVSKGFGARRIYLCLTNLNYYTTVTGNQFQKSFFKNIPRAFSRFGVGGARFALGRHVEDEHVKDAAKDVAKTLRRTWRGTCWGDAEDGSVKVLILSIVIIQRRKPRPTHA